MSAPFSPDHVWQVPDGNFLVQGPPLEPFSEFKLPPDAGAVAMHVLVTSAGEVIRTYSEPLWYAVDWTQGVCNVHTVVGSELRSYRWTEDQFGQVSVEVKFEVVLLGLRAVSISQLPSNGEALRAALGGEDSISKITRSV
jgi:hypothetical protein